MDGIISEHSRAALEKVSPAFRALQAQIRVVEDAKSGMNNGQMRVAEVLREPRARAYKKLFEAQQAFEEATKDLATQIAGEFRQEVSRLVEAGKPLNVRQLSAALSLQTQQDMRTFLVIGTLERLLKVSLEQSAYDLPHGPNSNAELFNEIFLEALQPPDASQHSIAVRQQRGWGAPAYTFDHAFTYASSALRSAMTQELQEHGWNRQQTGYGAMTLGMVTGAAVGTATAMGLSDAGSWLWPAVGLLGGGTLGAGFGAMGESVHMLGVPQRLIKHIGGAEVAGVAVEAQPLVAIHREVNPEHAAQMLADALRRAASKDKGRGAE